MQYIIIALNNGTSSNWCIYSNALIFNGSIGLIKWIIFFQDSNPLFCDISIIGSISYYIAKFMKFNAITIHEKIKIYR